MGIYLVNKKNKLINEFLRHGANPSMMMQLFRVNRMQLASRRKTLNLPSVIGRPQLPTQKDRKNINTAWLAYSNINKLVNKKEQLLFVARETGLSLTMIYTVARNNENYTDDFNF